MLYFNSTNGLPLLSAFSSEKPITPLSVDEFETNGIVPV